MGPFFYGLSLLMPPLLDHSVEIGLLICLIFLVKLVARKKLPPWWHYSLWLLLLVRMMVPLEFENRLNLFNFVPSVETPHVSELISEVPPEVELSAQPIVVEAQAVEDDIQFAVKRLIPVIWLTGALILGICILFESVTFWRNIRRRPKVTDKAVLALLSECKSRMKIKRKIDIVVTDNVRCPALFGYLRPRLLLPEGVFEKLSDRELSYAFMHELGHLKRHDIGVSWLMAVLQVIHWFNPLVWLAFYQIRIDQESACDAAVLSRMKPRQSSDYAKAIVGFLEKFCQNCQLPGLAGVLENRSQMRKRIARIVQYRKSSQKLSIAAFTLLVSAGFLLFSLTGVAAQKSGSASMGPDFKSVAFEFSGYEMESGPGYAEGAPVKIHVEASEVAYKLMQEGDLFSTVQSGMPSMNVPQVSAMSPQAEAPIESRAASSEEMEYAGSAKDMVAARSLIALNENSVTMPSRTAEADRNVALSPAEPEKSVSTPSTSTLPSHINPATVAVSESRGTYIGSGSDGMAAEQEKPQIFGEPLRASKMVDVSAAGQGGQVGSYVDLQKGADMAQSRDNVYQSVQDDTRPVYNHLKNEKNLTDSITTAAVTAADVDEMTEKVITEMYRDYSTASMASKRKTGGSSGTFQAEEVDTPPRLIKAYPPRYPYLAKRDDITGSIILQFVVTKEGNAVDMTVVQSSPKGVFDEAALQAIEQYRFEPGIKDGEAVDVKVNLPIKFNLT